MPTTSAVSLLQAPDDLARASALRSSCGFRLIRKRPLLRVEFVPSTPMNELRLATSGSLRIAAASACWRSAIAGYEMVCAASEMPWIIARVLHREEPLRDEDVEQQVTTSVSPATASVNAWWSSTQFEAAVVAAIIH